jgi:hypothetical protein
MIIWVPIAIGFTALLMLLVGKQYRIDIQFNQFQNDEEEDYE